LNEKIKIGVVILAAGSSSRLGFPKQLVEFRGKTLLEHILGVAVSQDFNPRILVLGSKAEEIQQRIDPGNFEVVINENWEEGMGTSISKGISSALSMEKELDHILILLSDQPFVSKEKIQELIKVQLDSRKPATFSEYAGEVGVPAIFSSQLFSELQKLEKDQGGKKLLLDKKIQFETVKFEGGNFDVDTANDVEFLRRMEEE
jgi:molybdenum cofactor cytidylyltransferase